MTEPFGTANGFAIAAAVTKYDGNSEEITDPTIGELKYYLKRWDDGLFDDDAF